MSSTSPSWSTARQRCRATCPLPLHRWAERSPHLRLRPAAASASDEARPGHSCRPRNRSYWLWAWSCAGVLMSESDDFVLAGEIEFELKPLQLNARKGAGQGGAREGGGSAPRDAWRRRSSTQQGGRGYNPCCPDRGIAR